LSVYCYAVPNTTEKKNIEKIIYEKKNFTIYRSCTVPIVVWPSFVAPFQLPWLRRFNYDRKKNETVVCLLLRHSNYDRKKKIQSFGHHLLRRSNCHCCAVPITTGKKRYLHLSVVMRFQLRPEKKDTVVWPSFVVPFQLPLLCRSNYDQKKKRYSRLYVVTPFQIRPEKKTWKKLFMRRRTSLSIVVAPFP
jgi:hypothetical protein